MTPSFVPAKVHDMGIRDPRKLVASFIGNGVEPAKPEPVPIVVKRTHIRRNFSSEKERDHFYYELSKLRRTGA